MKTEYRLLLWPHTNVRYQTEESKLAVNELRVILGGLDIAFSDLSFDEVYNFIVFKTDMPLDEAAVSVIKTHSLFYILFESDDGSLKPVTPRYDAYLGHDLPYILKYKGKTNEAFTMMLINMALYSAGFDKNRKIKLLDPMCARGTTLFQAVNRGFDAYGCDISKADLAECEKFFKKYLEFHHFKHSCTKKSNTLGKKPVPVTEFVFADTLDAYKARDTRMLSTAFCDCENARSAFPKTAFDIIVADLPYGVQHSAGEERFDKLMLRALPAWKKLLTKGGRIALSFNVNTIKRNFLIEALENAGLSVMRGEAYDSNAHWVEQAITRDIVVAVNR